MHQPAPSSEPALSTYVSRFNSCNLGGRSDLFLVAAALPPLRVELSGEWMFWLDAVGLGAFAAVGAAKGSLVDAPPLHWGACVSCAMFSATFGGFAAYVSYA